MKTVKISIVVHNTDIDVLNKCIGSIVTQDSNLLIDILINNKDFRKDQIKLYDSVRIRTIQNKGYGSGHNESIFSPPYVDYHLVLNPDTELKKGCIKECVKYMNENVHTSLLTAKLVYPNNRIQYNLRHDPTIWILFLRLVFPKSKLTKKLNNIQFLKPQNEPIHNIPNISGAFMFFRYSDLTSIGGFDKSYFMYMEDLDICRRIREVGRIDYNPKAECIHVFMKGSSKKIKLLFYHIQSVLIYFWKYNTISR